MLLGAYCIECWTVSQLNQPSLTFQAVDHMPCKCGGTKWLMTIQPAVFWAPADDEDHDQRTYECPRCEEKETLAIKFR